MNVNKIVIEVNIPDSNLDEFAFYNSIAVDQNLVRKFLEQRLGINRLLIEKQFDIKPLTNTALILNEY